MQKYTVDFDQDVKEDLIETAEYHFSDRGTFEQVPGVGNGLYRQLRGEAETMDLEVLDRLLTIVNESEPRYSLQEPTEYVEERTEHAGENRVVVDDEFQEFLFQPYNSTEIMDITGTSRSVARACRQGRTKTIPEEVYQRMFLEERSRQTEMMRDINPEVEIYSLQERANFEEPEPVVEGDIREVKKAREIVEGVEHMDPHRKGGMKSCSIDEAVEDIREVLNTSTRSTVGTGERKGYVYQFLEEIGLLTSVSSSNFLVEGDEGLFDVAFREMDRLKPDESGEKVEYTSEELVEVIKKEAEELGKTPPLAHFGENLPSKEAFEGHFGSYNNAVWAAGLEPREYGAGYSEEELLAGLLEKSREEKGLAPERADIMKDDRLPGPEVFEKESNFGSIEAALEEAGINPDITEIESDMRYRDLQSIGHFMTEVRAD